MTAKEPDFNSAKQQYVSQERTKASISSVDARRSIILGSPIQARTDTIREMAILAKQAADLPAPTPANVLPDEHDTQVNLLSKQQWFDNGLLLEGIVWGDTEGVPGGSDDVVTFKINGAQVRGLEFRFPYPVDPATVPDQFQISRQYLGIGERLLTFTVNNDVIDNPQESDGLVFTVDLTDPNVGDIPTPPVLPTSLVGDLTAEWLADNGDVLEVTIGTYIDMNGGDTYILNYGEDSEVRGDVPAIVPFTVEIPGDEIRKAGEGDQTIVYRLLDRAGNESKLSLTRKVRVVLTPQPSKLLAPEVPAANPVIDQVDARAGVDIIVPPYGNPQRDDKIEIYISNTDGSNPVLLDTIYYPELSTKVDYATLRARGDDYAANVHYTVTRGTGQPATSPSTLIQVDLSTVGPVNPDEPDPVNKNLDVPQVFGANSNVRDTIQPADKGQDAEAQFTLYTPLNAGEVIRLYYGGLPDAVAEYEVQPGDNAGDDFKISIPWDKIEVVGNGLIPVFYRIFKDAVATNYQQSVTADVTVTVSTVENMAKPALIGRGAGSAIINCAVQPWLGLTVRVSDTVNLAENDEITLVWDMYDAYIQTGGGALVPSTHGEFSVVIRNGAKYHDFPISYFPHMDFPKRTGHVSFFWRIKKAADGATGTSDSTKINYSLRQSNGYCYPPA